MALTVNASLDHPQLWLLYVLGAMSSGIFAVTYPTTRSLLPLLLEAELRPAAFALQATYGSFGMMAGPAVGGLLIGSLGLASAYGVDIATYVVALVAFFGLSPSPPVDGAVRASRDSVLQGLRFLRGHSVVMSVFGIDLLAMVFGMPRALFPALTERLGGGPALYGLLSSVAAGAFIASLSSGWTARVRRPGRAVLIAVAVWGITIAIAGLTHVPAVAMAMLAAAGAADMISGVYRSSIAAEVTPDDLRGRVSGVEIAVYAGGPVLGDVEAGVVGGLVSVPFAIVSGGLACVAGAAVFAAAVPSFARYVSLGTWRPPKRSVGLRGWQRAQRRRPPGPAGAGVADGGNGRGQPGEGRGGLRAPLWVVRPRWVVLTSATQPDRRSGLHCDGARGGLGVGHRRLLPGCAGCARRPPDAAEQRGRPCGRRCTSSSWRGRCGPAACCFTVISRLRDAGLSRARRVPDHPRRAHHLRHRLPASSTSGCSDPGCGALSHDPPDRPLVPGLTARALLTWTLGSAVPVGGLIVVAVFTLAGREVSTDRLAVTIVGLGGITITVGLLTTVLAARATTAAVQSGRQRPRPPGRGRRPGGPGWGCSTHRRWVCSKPGSTGWPKASASGNGSGTCSAARSASTWPAPIARRRRLGGEVREVGVVFVDVVGSTTLAAPALEPGSWVLNRFFAVVVDVVEQHGGFVNKFEGDAALAVFGAPVALDDPAGAALGAARDLAGRLAREVQEITAGIGASFGGAVAGNVGAEQRYEYTVIGDPVNEAARPSRSWPRTYPTASSPPSSQSRRRPRRGRPMDPRRRDPAARSALADPSCHAAVERLPRGDPRSQRSWWSKGLPGRGWMNRPSDLAQELAGVERLAPGEDLAALDLLDAGLVVDAHAQRRRPAHVDGDAAGHARSARRGLGHAEQLVEGGGDDAAVQGAGRALVGGAVGGPPAGDDAVALEVQGRSHRVELAADRAALGEERRPPRRGVEAGGAEVGDRLGHALIEGVHGGDQACRARRRPSTRRAGRLLDEALAATSSILRATALASPPRVDRRKSEGEARVEPRLRVVDRQMRSRIDAVASEPPQHMLMRARLPSRRSSSCRAVVMRRLPGGAHRWPSAMAPPLTLSLSMSGSCTWAHDMTTEAKASLTSNRSMSAIDMPVFSVASTGPSSR